MAQERKFGHHIDPDSQPDSSAPQITETQPPKISLIHKPFTREAIIEDLNLDTNHEEAMRALDSFMDFAKGATIKQHLFTLAQNRLRPFKRPKPGENKNGLNPLESTT